MATYYNASQPINIKEIYNQYDVVEYLVKMPTGRQMKAGSMRINGYLRVIKTLANGSTSVIDGTEGIFFDQYAGVHSCFRNTTTTVNGRTIESLQNYPRIVAMQTQHDGTPETIFTSSAHASELKGVLNNRVLVGDNATKGCPFSFKPLIAINKSSEDLPVSKFGEIKVLWQLGAGIESFYISGGAPTTGAITNVSFELRDLQLSWMETVENKALVNEPITLNTVFNMVQTITGLNNNIQIVSNTAYDAVSMSFLRQAYLNNLYLNSLCCEYIPDIDRIEFLIDGQSGPLTYAILPPVYQDIALNYWKSLDNSGSAIWRVADPVKNCIKNRFLSENGAFGIGCAYRTAINDKLQVALTINDDSLYNPSIKGQAIDCYIYINGFVTL
jgi:hypothetical protein